MDPRTVIVMLAIHLLGTGGLMFLVWRMMPGAAGLGRWWVASGLFGTAYLWRLVVGLDRLGPADVAADGLMLLAVLLFGDGVREFVGRAVRPVRTTVVLWCFIVAAVGAGALVGGLCGRHVVLNLAIGAMYAACAVSIGLDVRHQTRPLRPPLRLLATIVGVLSVLTLLRAGDILTRGAGVAYHGAPAQVYYMYASLAAVVVGLTLLWMLFLRLNGQLAQLASCDPLTGLLNRQGLDEPVRRHFERRDALALTVLLLDIDHFKRINDEHGHAAGDEVLKAVAASLVSHLRSGDFVARVGGEEFVIGCVGGEGDVALALARRVNEGVGRLQVPRPDGPGAIACTVSVGVSRAVASAAEWAAGARQADEALYQVKADGRNGVRPFAGIRPA